MGSFVSPPSIRHVDGTDENKLSYTMAIYKHAYTKSQLLLQLLQGMIDTTFLRSTYLITAAFYASTTLSLVYMNYMVVVILNIDMYI